MAVVNPGGKIRSMQTVNPKAGKKESAQSRLQYPAKSKMTAQSMRTPFGGK